MPTLPSASKLLLEKTLSFLSYTPEYEQRELLTALVKFVYNPSPRKAFVINGYAGTGKTSLMAALVRAMHELKLQTVTLAPTGRAAKVASTFSGRPATTIHRRIYRPIAEGNQDAGFMLASNRSRDTLFIIDEASMITDTRDTNSLLTHLIRYVYSSPGCSIIFLGDVAQLPPVGHTNSPAMELHRLRELGLYPESASLTRPMRQSDESGILQNATIIRKTLFSKPGTPFYFKTDFPDIEIVSSMDLEDKLSTSWNTVGMDETIIITRSNKRANQFNQEIRARILYAEQPIQQGEKLIISKNDYFWCNQNKTKGFLANGETAEVTWVGNLEKAYGRFFVDVELQLPDSETPIGSKIMLRSLVSNGPTIPREEQNRFFNIVMASQEGEYSEKLKNTLEDPFYNALQVKYGYCITCHKAQGGQWKHVYVDLSMIAPEALGSEFYRWLYTAVSRATKKLFLINPSVGIEQ